MTRESHDHNFKNLFSDFPKEALDWILPEAVENFGPIRKIEFLRQEPKKRKLSDAHLALDMPILFSFKTEQLLLWLVEFQDKKSDFSIYKLMRYTTDSMETHPKAIVLPTVLFTDRRKWRKGVTRQLKTVFAGKTFLHFEYLFVKLFEFNARDYFHSPNPLVRILLPKMNYEAEERVEVIRHALVGLYKLVTPMLFDKYSDFIDIYSEIREEERESIYQEINEEKESAMLMQYIKDKGYQEGRREGVQQGVQEGIHQGIRQGVPKGVHQGMIESLDVLIKAKFGSKGLKSLQSKIKNIADVGKLKSLIEVVMKAESPQEVLNFIGVRNR